MRAERIPVAWCTTAAARQTLELDSLHHPVAWTTPEDPFGDNAMAAEREGDESLETLMERVSGKLLSAKRGGRNRIVT